MKCENCNNYIKKLDTCKFCHFEEKETEESDWDILNIDETKEWGHIQILDRLHSRNIDCFKADMWSGDNMALLYNCKASEDRVAQILKIHEECIYTDYENSIMILNLFQEKEIRKGEQK